MSKGEQETSDFASRGTIPFPPTYEDNKQTAEFSTWPSSILKGKLALYLDFLERTDIMPRAKQTGARIIEHLDFELQWRAEHPEVDE